MTQNSRHLVFVIIVALVATAGKAAEPPLFLDSGKLHLTLEFPVDTLIREKEERPVLDGVLRYTNASGEPVEIEMSMTTRGKSRLTYCSFPPLTLNLKRKQTKATVYEGQNKLKIVTHCKNGSLHLRYVHQEYGIYRAFNVLTDYSYRVRMLEVTYRDTDGKRKDETHDAFFIEPHNGVGMRLGMQRLRVAQVSPNQLDAWQAATYTLFQYLIANTDWSMLKGPGEDGCCHNGKVIIKPGSQDGWIVLPYDFDQAGLINTKYSMPAPALGLRSVRQRMYRGRCQHNDELPATVEMFNQNRQAVEAAFIAEVLSERSQRSSMKYIDKFYDTINDPRSFEKNILYDCIGSRN